MLLVLLKIIPNTIELGGVVRTPIREFLNRYDSVHYVWIDGDMDRARSLVGTPFDPWGMLGILIKRNIHCVKSLFCAEYVALVATHFRDEFAHHQTAQTILAASRDTEWVSWDTPPWHLLVSKIFSFQKFSRVLWEHSRIRAYDSRIFNSYVLR
ncbi:hypothetical protein P4S73_04715 [Paraglaciecola sp. Hal342]